MKVLLIGGSGFVGGAVVRLLSRRSDFDVAAVTRGVTPQHWGGIEHIACDRSDAASLKRQLRGHTFDAVIDITAYTASEVTSVLSSLETAPEKYVMVSSAAVYDRRVATPPFVEADRADGDAIWGDYGVAKREAELAVLGCGAVYVLRPPYIFGPANNVEREQFLWARMLADEPILVPGDGTTKLQMCYVEDLARLLVDAAEGLFPAGTYNVGESSHHTFTAYIEALAVAAGLPVEGPSIVGVHDVEYSARQFFPFRNSDLTLDTTKLLQSHPMFEPVELRDGLVSTFGWFESRNLLEMKRNDVELELLAGTG